MKIMQNMSGLWYEKMKIHLFENQKTEKLVKKLVRVTISWFSGVALQEPVFFISEINQGDQLRWWSATLTTQKPPHR